MISEKMRPSGQQYHNFTALNTSKIPNVVVDACRFYPENEELRPMSASSIGTTGV